MLERRLLPPIFASVHSLRWQSKIRQNLSQLDELADIQWELTCNEAISAAALQKHSVVMIELPSNLSEFADSTMTSIAEACNGSAGAGIFVLGNDSQAAWRSVIIEAGAIATCFCMLEFEHFGERIRRFLNHHAIEEISVEQAVAARLRV